MRHEDIATTMKYYVGQNAEAMADTIWSAVGDTLGDTLGHAGGGHARTTAKTSGDDRI